MGIDWICMARVATGYLALALGCRCGYTSFTLTIGLVSSVGEYLLIAAANKLIRNMVMMIEREDVVDVMELRHMGSAGRTGPIGVLSAVSLKTADFDVSRQLSIMHPQPQHKIVDFHTRTSVSRLSDSIH